MTKKEVLIAWAVCLLVGLLALIVTVATQEPERSAYSTIKPGQKLLAEFNPALVETIVIEDALGSVTLEKAEATWKVAEREGYPADGEQVSDLLEKAFAMEVAQTEQAGPSQYDRLQLDVSAKRSEDVVPPLRIAFQKKETEAAELFFGTLMRSRGNLGGYAEDMGRFARVGGVEEAVFVVEDALRDVTADPKEWLASSFFKVSKLKSLAVSAPHDPAFAAWEVAREDPEGELSLVAPASGEFLDAAVATDLRTILESPDFEDVLLDFQPEPSEGERRVVLETFDGFSYDLRLVPLNEGLEEWALTPSISFTPLPEPAPSSVEAEVKASWQEEREREAEIRRIEAEADETLNALAAEQEAAGEGQPAEESQVEATLANEGTSPEEESGPLADGPGEPTEEERADLAKRVEEALAQSKEDYQKALAQAEEKFEREKTFNGVVYRVTQQTVASVLRTRSELLPAPEEEEASAEPTPPPLLQR
ncbi:MAG: DUF4340 domain-containing protein [Verrucomicrobiota bacterium]